MPVTLIVEPDLDGHRFQAVANVELLAGQFSEVVLLTSIGATSSDEFRVYLSDVRLKSEEVFDAVYPPTRTMPADPSKRRRNTVPPATPEDFAAVLLGIDENGNPRRRRHR